MHCMGKTPTCIFKTAIKIIISQYAHLDEREMATHLALAFNKSCGDKFYILMLIYPDIEFFSCDLKSGGI